MLKEIYAQKTPLRALSGLRKTRNGYDFEIKILNKSHRNNLKS